MVTDDVAVSDDVVTIAFKPPASCKDVYIEANSLFRDLSL